MSAQIFNLTQGNRTSAEYAIEFRTLAAQSGWNDIALKAMFQHSLNPELQTELACKGEDSSFSEFVTLAIRIDNLMRQAPKRKGSRGGSNSSQIPITIEARPHDEPMQLNVSRLSEGERERRRQHQLCFYCGEAGHRSLGCPHKSQAAPRVNIEQFSLLGNRSFTLPITLRTDTLSLELTAMIDSGAALNLISKNIVTKYNIPIQPCTPPIKIKAIDDTLIGEGITHQTKTLTLNVGLLHQESITLYIVDSPKLRVILGHPWLSIHDPDISWYNGELTHWSTFCINNCFLTKPRPCSQHQH